MTKTLDDVKEYLRGTEPEPLEPVPDNCFTDLLEILKKNVPHSLSAYGMVQNVINWRKNTKIPPDYRLYAPFGDFKHGTCVGIYSNDSLQAVTFYSHDANDQKLRTAFLTTTLFNWDSNHKQKFLICDVPEELVPMVKELATRKNFEVSCCRTVHFWMDKEQASQLEIKCPSGVELRPLEIDQITYLDQYWRHRFDGSQEYLKALLERNFGIGVYLDGSKLPVSWVVLSHNNCMIMLYTLTTHRRKGYARLVCNAMAKRLAQMNVYSRATAMLNNYPSKMLFTKMGYTPMAMSFISYLHLNKK